VFEAKLGDDGRFHFAWNGVAVELGVRRCFTTPVLAPEQYPSTGPIVLRQAQDERALGKLAASR
jgi:hypothetical protein